MLDAFDEPKKQKIPVQVGNTCLVEVDEAYFLDMELLTQYVLFTERNKKMQELMELQKQRDLLSSQQMVRRSSSKKTGRNQPCPCGSGRKYKRCCGRKGA